MSDRYIPNRTPCGRTRREFLWEVGGGFAGLALIDLLARDGFFARADSPKSSAPYLLAPRPAHFAAKAKRVIHLFMAGAPSQLDLFDYKPQLAKLEGKPLHPSVIRGQRYAFIRSRLFQSNSSRDPDGNLTSFAIFCWASRTAPPRSRPRTLNLIGMKRCWSSR